MGRRKLIFFVRADAADDAASVIAAYDLAATAAAAAVPAEVRLAGAAVLVADPTYVATLPLGRLLRERVDRAVGDGIEVSACPRSVSARGIHDDQLAAIGARSRPLADILVEVADGRSVLLTL